jgi:hypothetical protein
LTIAYSNRETAGTAPVRRIPAARFHHDGHVSTGPAAAAEVTLRPREVQVLVP